MTQDEKLFSCFFLTVFLCLPVAQAQEEIFDYNLNSPYDTIVTHLGYLKTGNYHPEIATKAFSQENRTQQEAAVLAIEPNRLLKEHKVDIDLSQVPKDKHYLDPKAKYHKYQLT
jgi:MscS family membrane protein